MNQAELERELEELHEVSFHWALSCCQWKHHEAEELIQACYLKVLDGKARFRAESSLKTWFFAVIKNTAREHYRRQRVKEAGYLTMLREALLKEDEIQPAFETDLQDTEERQRIKQSLLALPKRQRQVIELMFYHDMTIEEAAKVCGISLGTARTHYDRGKKKLLELLDHE